MLLIECNVELIEEIKSLQQKTFKMKDQDELMYFLDIEFARLKQGITMYQRKYALKIISEAGLSAAKSIATPIDYNVKLTSKQYDEHNGNGNTGKRNDPPTNQVAFQR